MPPLPPHEIRKPSVVIARAVSSTVISRLRRRASGTPVSTAPKTINPPIHGSLGAWFAAELDAVIVRVTVLLPLADSVAVPLDGLTVIRGELVVAVHEVVSANVVEASATVSDCESPLLNGTDVPDGVIVYAGAVTVSVCVPVDAMKPEPDAGL